MTNNLQGFRKSNFNRLITAILASAVFAMPIAGCGGKRPQIHEVIIPAYDERLVVNTIYNLVQLEIDSFHAYTEISKVIKNKEFNFFCNQMRLKHEKHIANLSAILLNAGVQPPIFIKEFTGFVTPGYTLIQGAKNQYRALQALQTDEIISNKIYDRALNISMPEDIKEIIWRNAEEEKIHLDEVESRLKRLKKAS